MIGNPSNSEDSSDGDRDFSNLSGAGVGAGDLSGAGVGDLSGAGAGDLSGVGAGDLSGAGVGDLSGAGDLSDAGDPGAEDWREYSKISLFLIFSYIIYILLVC